MDLGQNSLGHNSLGHNSLRTKQPLGQNSSNPADTGFKANLKS